MKGNGEFARLTLITRYLSVLEYMSCGDWKENISDIIRGDEMKERIGADLGIKVDDEVGDGPARLPTEWCKGENRIYPAGQPGRSAPSVTVRA